GAPAPRPHGGGAREVRAPHGALHRAEAARRGARRRGNPGGSRPRRIRGRRHGPMSLASSRNRLAAALKELLARWELARTQWDDPMSHECEAQYLQLLEPKLRNTLTAMEKLDAVLARARHECG